MRHEPQQWIDDYQRDGYLVVEDVLEPDHVQRLREGVERITADPDNLPPRLKRYISFERDFVQSRPQYNELSLDQIGNAVRNIMDLPLFEPQFAELVFHEPQLDILEALFGATEFSFLNYKCIVKAARVGSRFRWHRDYPYLEHTTDNIITSMLCIDDMTEASGATVVLPGSHRVPQAEIRSSDREIPEEDLPSEDEFERVTVCCPAGSIVVFHASILHGGGPNRSDHPRRNIISIWRGPDTYPITGARHAYEGLMPRSKDTARQRQAELTQQRIALQREKAAAAV